MRFLTGYILGLAVATLIAVLAFYGTKPAPPPEPDWAAIAACEWERWDGTSDMAPVARFCFHFGHDLYGG